MITGLALNHILQNNFKESVGMRPNSKRIGVLITDGKSQDDVNEHSQSLRDQGIELYAIGEQISSCLFITVVNPSVLTLMASLSRCEER